MVSIAIDAKRTELDTIGRNPSLLQFSKSCNQKDVLFSIGKEAGDEEPMKWGQWLLCGWPGLTQLWLRGSFAAMFWAIIFSITLNLALVATFLWPALLGDLFPVIAWPVIFLVWMASTGSSVHFVEELSHPPKMVSDQERNEFSPENIGNDVCDEASESGTTTPHTLFNRAQREYLRGHWNEAESFLKERINQAERDIEARLLLATLYRRKNLFDSAVEQLLQLEKFDDSVHWKFEIDRERQLIAQGEIELNNEDLSEAD
ncbi:MAG: hypothetical protein AAGA30_08525 [Planctomycetota bacterium]